MDNNTAYAYVLDDNYASIYVVLSDYEQLIFYWNLKDDCEKRKPKWRVTKDVVKEGMNILSYNKFGCVLEIDGRRAEFEWYEYDRDTTKDNGPKHKGKLVNFAEWRPVPKHQEASPTQFENYSGYYSGNYSQAQDYEDE